MPKSVSLFDCITLGSQWWLLNNPGFATAEMLSNTTGSFRQHLQLLGLRATEQAASVFHATKYFVDQRTTLPIPESANALKFGMGIVNKVLEHEAVPRQMIALRTADVSDKLQKLGEVLKDLTPSQQNLFEETILCVECEAYRAAAVMAWNLAYDRIRYWVFTNRLSDFNLGLAAENPSKPPIAHEADFFRKDAPGEGLFLKACQRQEAGPIIGGELYDHLVQYLRYRNKYAHSSEIQASREKTNGYIDHLLDIITTTPFA
jgi:hypothetical protein